MKRKKTFIFYLYSIYTWIVFVPLISLLTLFFGSLATVLALILNPRIASFIGGAIWARLLAYLTPITVKVSGKSFVDKKQSYVIISNHQSYYDVLVLYGWLGLDFRWVMKQELRKVPGLGIGCKTIGHVFIDRSHPDKAKASIRAASKTIKDGTSVLFFPEGTRTLTGKIGKFKKGAFHFAIELGLPILPVTIIGTKDVLPAHSSALFPGKTQLIFHKPIETTSYSKENMQNLMDIAKESIISALPEKYQ